MKVADRDDLTSGPILIAHSGAPLYSARTSSIREETHPEMTTTGRSNWQAALKTGLLLATLGGLLVGAGFLIGGPRIALLFLLFSIVINLGSWFFSDKIALAAARAQPVSEEEDPRLYQMVRDLTTRAGL